jgi:hypothetical protein
MRTAASVASMWRQVQGSDDWAGLLEPLHPVVRDEVARYGDLVDACYAALDTDPSSRRYMCCKHGKERVLQQAAGGGADAGRGYEVTRYIYATPDVTRGPSSASVSSNSSSWVGYVAVSTDETTRRLGRRDVLVAFRGTVSWAEWTANLMSSLKTARLGDARSDEVRVESGFLNLYTSSSSAGNDGMGSCREQLLREVSRLITSFSDSNPAAGGTNDMSVSASRLSGTAWAAPSRCCSRTTSRRAASPATAAPRSPSSHSAGHGSGTPPSRHAATSSASRRCASPTSSTR